MKRLIFFSCFFLCAGLVPAQNASTELYDFIKNVISDSTGYPIVGDWSVNKLKTAQVKWKTATIQISDDTSINFYRQGTSNFMVNGKKHNTGGKPLLWNIMLKGPRAGYTSFSILSGAARSLAPKMALDSLFGKRPYSAKLLKRCDGSSLAGFYYYEVKLPKKDIIYLRLSWISLNGNTALRIDGYDAWSSYAAKLHCKGSAGARIN